MAELKTLPGNGKPAHVDVDTLYSDVWDAIEKHRGCMLFTTAVGVLELVKSEVIEASKHA